MERKIGEIFEYNGEWYQCADWAVNPCSKCDFDGEGICCDELPCTSSQRKDKKYVFFKKLEKVGEPFSCNYYGDKRLIMMQEYRAYDNRIILPNGIPMYVTDEKHKKVAIEIKQNQEDMEEKYSNDWVDDYVANKESDKPTLKPFDLQQAKDGKPVCTRNGKKARIICFDVKAKKPIAALITNDDTEEVHFYYDNGRSDQYLEYRYDLMMIPEKKEGWVNVYNSLGVITFSHNPYDTKEEALASETEDHILNKYYVDTVKVEWKE